MPDDALTLLADELIAAVAHPEAEFERLDRSQRELARRCAVPRSLDRDVLAAVVAPGVEIAELLDARIMEPLRGRTDTFRMPPSLREAALQAWSDDPEALAALHAQLAAYWREARPEEAIHHLIAADEPFAPLFLQRFDELDAAFDLAGCRTLLDALRPHRSRFAALYGDQELRLDRRLYWAEDWHRTTRFLERKAISDVFDSWLAGDGSRVLQLYAAGGMGKTMHLRWLTSRVCAPRGIACARLDFDRVVPAVALQEPWLALLNLAEQLNHQLQGAPLTELLYFDSSNERARLYSPADGARVRANPPTDAVRERLAAQVPHDAPVVLILDTLEVALLRTGSSLAPLLDQLVALHDASHSVRLVFAGRFDLAQRLPERASLFAGSGTLRLPPFTEPEREAYLREIRGVTDDDLVRTISRRSGGSPFKLALITDIVRSGRPLSREDLDAYDDVDLMYLLERVLLRVDEPDVRWALRYGALGRNLDRDLFVQALAPVLERERRHEGDDDPNRGLPRAAFEHASAALNPDAVWTDLRRYVDEASWVELATDRAEALRFHPDVLAPMRRLVREHRRTFRRVHSAAAAYYERRAREDADGWGRWMADALYHRMQIDPERGAAAFRRRLRQAERAGRGDHRLTLIGDLLGGDYAIPTLAEHPDGDPTPERDPRPAPPVELVADALYEQAGLLIDAADAGDLSAWSRAHLALTLLDRVDLPDYTAERVAPLRAALELRTPDPALELEPALRRWEPALWRSAETLDVPAERLRALLELAWVLTRIAPEQAARVLRDALETAGPEVAPAIRARLIDLLSDQGDIAAALDEHAIALRRREGPGHALVLEQRAAAGPGGPARRGVPARAASGQRTAAGARRGQPAGGAARARRGLPARGPDVCRPGRGARPPRQGARGAVRPARRGVPPRRGGDPRRGDRHPRMVGARGGAWIARGAGRGLARARRRGRPAVRGHPRTDPAARHRRHSRGAGDAQPGQHDRRRRTQLGGDPDCAARARGEPAAGPHARGSGRPRRAARARGRAAAAADRRRAGRRGRGRCAQAPAGARRAARTRDAGRGAARAARGPAPREEDSIGVDDGLAARTVALFAHDPSLPAPYPPRSDRFFLYE